jgi:hypothetical protein
MGMPFTESVKKLTGQPLGSQAAYQVKKLCEKLMKERERIQKEYQALVAEWATKDADGKVVHPNPQDPNSFDVPEEKMEGWVAAQNAFGEREFSVNCTQVPFQALGKLEFSAAELTQISPLIAFPPELEAVPSGEPATVTPIGGAVPADAPETGGVA